MELLGVFIAILLVLLFVLVLYVAVSWTLWRKTRQRTEEEMPYKHLAHEEDTVHTKVAAVYAQENMPKFSITTVQPRPEFPVESLDSASGDDDDDDDDLSESQHPDLGRLYFSLRYDPHRSVLIVCLARAEDIPIEPEASGTFVDVHLLPLNTQSQTFQPHDTSISVSFREIYEFPLTKRELAVQTLDFHICRYDRYSRRTSLGDVFLALAELGAQGIDLSREVFLCRNIISSQQIYSAVEKKGLYQTDEEEQEEEEDGEQKGQKMSRKSETDAGSPWKILTKYVRSGKYKKSFGLETTMLWEPLFTKASSVDDTGFYSAVDSPVKTDERTKEDNSSAFTFPPRETGERQRSSGSSQTSPLQISPAPKDYYKIVPITPFAPSGPSETRQQSLVRAPQSHSWQLPEFKSRDDDDDIVLRFAESGEEPRVASSTRVGKKRPTKQETRGAKVRKALLSRGARHKGAVSGAPSKKLRKAPSSPRRRKTSPRPEGRAKTRSRARTSSDYAPLSKASQKTSSQSPLSSASESSLPGSLRVSAEPSERFPGIRGPPVLPFVEGSYSSVDTEEFRTPLVSSFVELGVSARTLSDADVNIGRTKRAAAARRSSSTGDIRSKGSADEDAA